MTRAVLSIGSNEGDRLANLRSAVDAFSPYLLDTSAVFQTPPWGPVPQPQFLNAVLVVADDGADAIDWLARGQACEQAAGRLRDVHWGPRTLDVDVITVTDSGRDIVSGDPLLTLPHPRAAERAFVLVPWWSVDPEAELPGHGSVLELMQALPRAEVEAVRMMAGMELRG